MKFLQEDLLASLIVRLVLALCCLYLSWFSDKGLVLNFPRIHWRSMIIVFHSSVNQGLLCFGYVVVLGMVLFAILIRVFVKCITGSSWFLFVSGIRVSRHSFFCRVASLLFWSSIVGFLRLWVWFSCFSIFYYYWKVVTAAGIFMYPPVIFYKGGWIAES